MEKILSEVSKFSRLVVRTLMCIMLSLLAIALLKKFTPISVEGCYFIGGYLLFFFDKNFHALTKQ